jgi:N-hydroxyarylamine O-acetyltransferase
MTTGATTLVDLDAYADRIGYEGEFRPTLAVLEALHECHARHIPFENLDILLGRPIRLDLSSLEAKLVRARRGGYCFEQNALFAAVLEQVGFLVTRLAARVRYGATHVLPRTHMLLGVEVEGESWLADVGFGTMGLLRPVPLVPGRLSRQDPWCYQVEKDPEGYVLRGQEGDAWPDLYAFTLERQFPVDYELANYYTSTHPQSRFVQILTAQMPAPPLRYRLINRELSVISPAEKTTRTITGDDELLEVLAKVFGLEFPAGTRFAVNNAPAGQ